MSGVIRLTRNSRTSLGCDEKLFKTVVKTAFGQRRKTLKNSLSGLIPADSAIMKDEIMTLRPEKLGVEDFIKLTLAASGGRENAGITDSCVYKRIYEDFLLILHFNGVVSFFTDTPPPCNFEIFIIT